MTPTALTTLGTTTHRTYSIQSVVIFVVILAFGYGMIRWRNRHGDRNRPGGPQRPNRGPGPAPQDRGAVDPNRWEAPLPPTRPAKPRPAKPRPADVSPPGPPTNGNRPAGDPDPKEPD